jgi:hypothetical protein
MADYLSPDQEDPEKRIKELEQGLADFNYAAPPQQPSSYPPPQQPGSYPPPQQPPPVPNYGYNPAAGSTPAWSPPPVPPGYSSSPFFGSSSSLRRGRSRSGAVVMFAVFVPVVIGALTAIPWHSLNMFGLGGPTKVPQGGSLTVNDNSVTKTVECNDGHLGINGNNLTITVTGHCASLSVNGTNHHITVDKADSIDANGINNVITYHSGEPKISKNGIDVTIQQG